MDHESEDSVADGTFSQVKHLIRGVSSLPVLVNEDGTFLTHPQQVGSRLREEWSDFLSPEDSGLGSAEMEAMLQKKLLQTLWPFEARTLVEAPNQAEEFAKVVRNLIVKHDARLVGQEWELGNTAGFKKQLPTDPWASGADPWAAARTPGV